MSILLKNCLIYDFDKGQTLFTDILIEGHNIKALAQNIDSTAAEKTIDIKESFVLPGLIDCHTHLGIIEEATGKIGIDNNEISNPVTPGLRGIDAVNPMDIAFKDAVKAGVTTIMTGPGSDNVVGGQSIVTKTFGEIIDQMVIISPASLKIAFGENPMTLYGTDKKAPVTRMGIAYLIRQLFSETQDYIEAKKAGKIHKRNLNLEAVIPILEGHIPLRAHAHRADDIITAIRIASEFGIKKLIIEHGTEADLVKEYLKEKEVSVAFGPMLTPRIKMELKRRNYGSACRLAEAGVKISLITDHPYNSIDQLRTLAILANSEGLSLKDTLKCITIHPAEMLGLDQKLGQLKPGFDADLVVFNGEPLDPRSKVKLTIINGKVAYMDD